MMNLSLYDTVWLVGGAIAAGLLWGIFVSAIKRRGTPLPLLLLILGGALWYTGDALRILIEQASPGAPATVYAAQAARFGMCFLPSALLATVLISADEQRTRIAGWLRRNPVPLAVVPGLTVFLIGLWDMPLKRVGFSLYTIPALLYSAWLCRGFAGQLATEVQTVVLPPDSSGADRHRGSGRRRLSDGWNQTGSCWTGPRPRAVSLTDRAGVHSRLLYLSIQLFPDRGESRAALFRADGDRSHGLPACNPTRRRRAWAPGRRVPGGSRRGGTDLPVDLSVSAGQEQTAGSDQPALL